ncbi:MAG: phosphatidate cytidylyltransferase [Actinobacteria bacterium]|nr:phosphatidate cytidylyltransferase [Actinomycetota bacterium]
MSPLVSRLVVSAVGLPVVLLAVHYGGGWLLALTLAAALLALHEFYRLTRPLRPVVIAGYVGTVAAIVGAAAGGSQWMVAGFLSTLPLAFLLKGLSETRQSATVAVGSTMLGVGWIGLGLAHLVLIRDLPQEGRLALYAVLIADFAANTAAYFAGRIFGRHRMAPRISPGKTWEGFVAGSAAAIFATWIVLYKTDFPVTGWRSLVLGGVIAMAAALGDLFESLLKRDLNVKDTGRLLAAHGGMLDRIDSLLFVGAAAFFTILAFGGA